MCCFCFFMMSWPVYVNKCDRRMIFLDSLYWKSTLHQFGHADFSKFTAACKKWMKRCATSFEYLRCYLRFCKHGKPVPHIYYTNSKHFLFSLFSVLLSCIFRAIQQSSLSIEELCVSSLIVIVPSLEKLWDSRKLKTILYLADNIMWFDKKSF